MMSDHFVEICRNEADVGVCFRRRAVVCQEQRPGKYLHKPPVHSPGERDSGSVRGRRLPPPTQPSLQKVALQSAIKVSYLLTIPMQFNMYTPPLPRFFEVNPTPKKG